MEWVGISPKNAPESLLDSDYFMTYGFPPDKNIDLKQVLVHEFVFDENPYMDGLNYNLTLIPTNWTVFITY